MWWCCYAPSCIGLDSDDSFILLHLNWANFFPALCVVLIVPFEVCKFSHLVCWRLHTWEGVVKVPGDPLSQPPLHYYTNFISHTRQRQRQRQRQRDAPSLSELFRKISLTMLLQLINGKKKEGLESPGSQSRSCSFWNPPWQCPLSDLRNIFWPRFLWILDHSYFCHLRPIVWFKWKCILFQISSEQKILNGKKGDTRRIWKKEW